MKKTILLYDDDVVFKEITANKHKTILAIIVWMYIPDFTYKNRNYMIADV
jgi:hypothetical protein